MIRYFEATKIFALETESISYVFGLNSKGVPLNIYFGERLRHPEELAVTNYDDNDRYRYHHRPAVYPQEYVTFGMGLYDDDSLKIRHADGVCDTELLYESHIIDRDTLTVVLTDTAYKIKVKLIYTLHTDRNFIERRAEIINEGATATIENVASANVFLPSGKDYAVETLWGCQLKEYRSQTTDIPHGKFVMETRRVITSGPHHVPFFSVYEKNSGITETAGVIFFGMLKYSGDFRISFEKNEAKAVKITAGINFYDNKIELATGESFETPSLLLSYTKDGRGGMRRLIYDLEYKELASNNIRKPFPIIHNSWYPCQFDLGETVVKAAIDKASSIGAELFVIDDGWMKGRTSDEGGLGDWQEDREKFPHGLRYISDYAHEKGMLFGLWVEPEMITEDSELYRAHPDWVLGYETRATTYERNQRVLDMSRDEVYEYAVSTLDRIITDCNLDYLKFDMNRYVCEKGKQSDFGIRLAQNVMRMYRHVRTTYPNLLIENCAHGGARADYGLFKYCDRINRSDNCDPVDVLRMHDSFIDMFPPRYAGGAGNIAPSPHNVNKRTTPLEYRARLGMSGSMSVGINLMRADESTLNELREHIAYYKTLRPLLHNTYIYKLTSPYPEKAFIWEYLSRNGDGAVIFLFAHGLNFGEDITNLKPICLDGNAVYSVNEKHISGDTLMKYGLNIQTPRGDYQSMIIEIKKIT